MTALPEWSVVSDAELACAAAAGDRAAFARIYDRYADRLHDFCVGMVRDRDTAADCVQDVFCTAATQLAGLRDPDKLRPWLYAIARREALHHLRDRRREQVSDELPDAPSAEAGPDTLAARSELADLITEAAGGLSERDRTVLELSYRHGLDGPALAEALGVSPAHANKIASRLRESIETSLGALLVARRARNNPTGCLELGAILADWDGRFSMLMRKRIARHIESCPTCEQDRRKLVNPVALLGGAPLFIPAPAWLRNHTLHQIQLTSVTTAMTSTSTDPGHMHPPNGVTVTSTEAAPRSTNPASHQNPVAANTRDHFEDAHVGSTRRLMLLAALVAATLAASAGLTRAWLYHQNVTISPTVISGTAPPPTPTAPPTTAPAPHIPPPMSAHTTAPALTPSPSRRPPPVQTWLPAAPSALPPVEPPAPPPPVTAPIIAPPTFALPTFAPPTFASPTFAPATPAWVPPAIPIPSVVTTVPPPPTLSLTPTHHPQTPPQVVGTPTHASATPLPTQQAQ